MGVLRIFCSRIFIAMKNLAILKLSSVQIKDAIRESQPLSLTFILKSVNMNASIAVHVVLKSYVKKMGIMIE